MLEPGVNFFVLVLEMMGATTHFSCEGHPRGFYIVFRAEYPVAVMLHSWGFFNVEVEGSSRWSIRLPHVKTHADRRRVLQLASKAWTAGMTKLLPKRQPRWLRDFAPE